jgi:predicted nuclease with TOPRIM domain
MKYFWAVILFLALAGTSVYLYLKLEKSNASVDAGREEVKKVLADLSNEREARKADQEYTTYAIDSLEEVYSKTKTDLTLLKGQYSELYADYAEMKANTNSDSMLISDCDTIVDAANSLIAGLEESLEICDSVSGLKSLLITSLALDTASYSASLRRLEAFSVQQDLLIQSLNKQNNTWWARNKTWVAFLGGAVATSVVVSLTNK